MMKIVQRALPHPVRSRLRKTSPKTTISSQIQITNKKNQTIDQKTSPRPNSFTYNMAHTPCSGQGSDCPRREGRAAGDAGGSSVMGDACGPATEQRDGRSQYTAVDEEPCRRSNPDRPKDGRLSVGPGRGGMDMTTFTVWKYDDPAGADHAVSILQRAADEGLVKIDDHAVVSWPEGAERPTTKHGHEDTWRGTGWGALFGLLFGAL